jgi:hypothetical protein
MLGGGARMSLSMLRWTYQMRSVTLLDCSTTMDLVEVEIDVILARRA